MGRNWARRAQVPKALGKGTGPLGPGPQCHGEELGQVGPGPKGTWQRYWDSMDQDLIDCWLAAWAQIHGEAIAEGVVLSRLQS